MENGSVKKTKRRAWRIALFAALAALALSAALLFTGLFLIGSPVSGGVVCKVRVDGTHLELDAAETGSADVISSIRFKEEDGVVTVRMRRVLTGVLRGADHAEFEAQNEIREVRFNGGVLWPDGGGN